MRLEVDHLLLEFGVLRLQLGILALERGLVLRLCLQGCNSGLKARNAHLLILSARRGRDALRGPREKRQGCAANERRAKAKSYCWTSKTPLNRHMPLLAH